MPEEEFTQTVHREQWLNWIKKLERPKWFEWFGLYPARASVEAVKAYIKQQDIDYYGSEEKG